MTKEELEALKHEIQQAFYKLGSMGVFYVVDLVLPDVPGVVREHLMMTNLHTGLSDSPDYHAVLQDFREKIEALLDPKTIELLRHNQRVENAKRGN